jgi:hypothetical protein
MKIYLILFLILVAAALVWSVVGYFSSRVEQAKYSVLEKGDGYEVRLYPAHITAQTVVEGAGTNGDALNTGFSIIAWYIFGENVARERVAMTAPVVTQGVSSEKIAMTAPVATHADGTSRVVSFVMPSRYTLATLPIPNDPSVQLVEVPEQKIAALTFSGYATDGRFEKMQERLLAYLSRDHVTTVGVPSYAGYNPPWTPPWMNRNEVMIEVEK